jgi:hypothetical protein
MTTDPFYESKMTPRIWTAKSDLTTRLQNGFLCRVFDHSCVVVFGPIVSAKIVPFVVLFCREDISLTKTPRMMTRLVNLLASVVLVLGDLDKGVLSSLGNSFCLLVSSGPMASSRLFSFALRSLPVSRCLHRRPGLPRRSRPLLLLSPGIWSRLPLRAERTFMITLGQECMLPSCRGALGHRWTFAIIGMVDSIAFHAVLGFSGSTRALPGECLHPHHPPVVTGECMGCIYGSQPMELGLIN